MKPYLKIEDIRGNTKNGSWHYEYNFKFNADFIQVLIILHFKALSFGVSFNE